MEDNHSPKIRKVPVLMLIQVLSQLHNKGVDYIDIYGVLDEQEDTIGFSFDKSYINQAYIELYQDILGNKKPSDMKVKLSDEDLNQLM